ncbi:MULTISPECIES: SPFH domain-containing protein [Herbaspirillum]|nr:MULTISPECIES: SPFH domain-containing protein [Herbaspirillum]MCP1574429.1 flotillin [Herbaspirillum rubrisubalbicans]NQE50197.1 SPFH domain-containing protein [Herbaspirillum rubrisubalbicans]
MNNMNILELGLIAAAVLLLALIVIIAVTLRRVVPTNMVHIVQTSHSSTPYGRGKPAGNTYYAWPSWVPKLGITVTEFPESIFQVALNNYEAYDKERLPFVIDAVAFFRVDNAETAAQRVATFDALHTDLKAVLQGAVRRVLATNALEDIMQSRAELGAQFTAEVQEQISQWGVLPVKTIEFMDLRDANGSNVINNVMAKEKSRIDMESRVKVAENQRQAELAEIDAKRTVEVQRQDAAQQIGLRTAEKEKQVGIANEQAQQEIKAAAKTTTERDMDVKKVQEVRGAEIARDVAAVRAEQEKQVAVVNADAQKQVQVINADAQKQAVTTKAEGDLAAALKEADGIRARGEAAAAAEQAMLMAPVTTQIQLAKEIGANAGYQQYLITIKQVEVGRDVGLEMARAMQHADLKVIANAGDMQQGVASLGDLFTPAGGTKLTGMLAALSQTPEGRQFLDHVTPLLAKGATTGALVGAASGSATAGAVAGAAAQK